MQAGGGGRSREGEDLLWQRQLSDGHPAVERVHAQPYDGVRVGRGGERVGGWVGGRVGWGQGRGRLPSTHPCLQ
jgi:hypothetical protein